MPIAVKTPPTLNKASCGRADIQGSNNPSPTDAPPARVPAPRRNSPRRASRGRRIPDNRNHLFMSNNQRLRTIQAATATGAWTSNASTPSTSSGPPTVRTAMADKPSTWAIRPKRRSGNHADSASATGTINAVPSDPTRSLAEPREVLLSGLPAYRAKKTMRKQLARMPVAPAA